MAAGQLPRYPADLDIEEIARTVVKFEAEDHAVEARHKQEDEAAFRYVAAHQARKRLQERTAALDQEVPEPPPPVRPAQREAHNHDVKQEVASASQSATD